MMPKIPRTINDGHKNVMADNEIVIQIMVWRGRQPD